MSSSTDKDRLTAMFDAAGIEYNRIDNSIVLEQGMVKTTGHYGLRSQFMFSFDGRLKEHEVIDTEPNRNNPA